MREKKLTVAVINLGCKVNKYESDSMKDKLAASGFEIVSLEDIADVYVVNTCSVTNMAEKKSRQMLRRAKRRNPQAIVVATGCFVNSAADVLAKENYVDILVGNNYKKDIVDIIHDYIDCHKMDRTKPETDHEQRDPETYIDPDNMRDYEEMGDLNCSFMDHQRAYIKIQDGCNQFCSYCIIPYTRGRVRSRRPENILREIRKLADSGVKEFVLTGIHISSYGTDFQGNELSSSAVKADPAIENLSDLVCEICKIEQVKRVRLGSLEPRIITEDFLNRISVAEKLCPHFHLSLQSACNATLKRMNRKYTIEEFKRVCELLRMYYDRPAITTDIIVGFPGETDDEFNITLKNIAELGLYEIHVFKYSVRSGTVAANMPWQVSEETKNKRSNILLELTSKQKIEYESSLSGLTDEVLIEEMIPEYCSSLDQNALRGKVRDAGAAENHKRTNKQIMKYTGHTRRYVKVEVEREYDIINHIISYVY